MSIQSAAQQTATSTKRQFGRTWAVFLMLFVGLWLIRSDTIVSEDQVLLWKFLSLPAALGALGVGSWIIRITLFRDRADSATWPGILLNAAILIAVALVVAGIVGV
ncbi:MAG: hypothetical protein LC798_13740 [Chloroflexi bacterium]|nr:hypothetical protein [Chloroflexota bacterium]